MTSSMLPLAATLFLALVLGCLAWIDLRSFRLPDALTLPLIVLGLAISALPFGIGMIDSIAGAAVGFLLFWGIGHLYFRRHGIDGLGLGDAKLFAASGSWVGVSELPFVLLIASLGGLAFAVVRKSGKDRRIAFGPWLCLGYFIVWLKVIGACLWC